MKWLGKGWGMSGTPGEAEGSDRDDSMSTGVAIPSRQLAYEAPTISRVMSEQRGDGHLETSPLIEIATERPRCHHLRQIPVRGYHQPHVHADGSRATQAVVTAQELLRGPEGLDVPPYRPDEAHEGLTDCFIN